MHVLHVPLHPIYETLLAWHHSMVLRVACGGVIRMQIFSLEIKPNVCADWFGNQGNQGKIRPVPPTS